jgi:hypothetical protein
MKQRFTVPNNFNAEELIEQRLPDFPNPKGIKPQNLNFLCDLILSKMINYKEDYLRQKNAYGYVNLKAEYLRKFVKESKNCIDFLMYCNVIKRDNFIKGIKSYGYKFYPEYIGTGFKTIDIKGVFKTQINEKIEECKSPQIQKLDISRKSLINFINSKKFKMDEEKASAEIDKVFDVLWKEAGVLYEDKIMSFSNREKRLNENKILPVESVQKKLLDLSNKQKRSRYKFYEKRKNLQINRDKFKHLVSQINIKPLAFINDESGHRLHTPITRLPKYLRKYLSYDNKPLISLDIKNSQPYLSLQILNGEFFKKTQGKKNNKLNKGRSLLCTLSAETIENIEDSSLRNYINDVLSGELYDRFVNVAKNDPLYYSKRNKIKKDFLLALYDIPREMPSSRTKRFIEAYPMPFENFNSFKQIETGTLRKRRLYSKENRKDRFLESKFDPNDSDALALNKVNAVLGLNKPEIDYKLVDEGYARLACILQRLESYLVLDVVCKRIQIEKPKVPLVTVHDSIATTEENVNYVEGLIKEELKKAIGFEPKIEKEPWT